MTVALQQPSKPDDVCLQPVDPSELLGLNGRSTKVHLRYSYSVALLLGIHRIQTQITFIPLHHECLPDIHNGDMVFTSTPEGLDLAKEPHQHED